MKGLPYEVRTLIQKARESALLAVETYNRPTAQFRSGAYVVLMIIAWTSLFHAVFFRKRRKPYYRRANSTRYQKVGGEYRRWELSECLAQHYGADNPAVRQNLEFFIALRNRIEHCSLAELDPEIFGECQAMLLNFETMLCEQFGERYAIRGGLTYALQFSKIPPKTTNGAGKARDKAFRCIKQFITAFRSSLSTDILSDLSYSFKVFLVPKIGNHASGDAVAVEFVKYDPTRPEQMAEYDKIVALIKPKEVPVANLGLLRPSEVVKAVAARLGKPFNMHHHVLCYRHFNARPPKAAADPKACDGRYCVYDTAHRDYLYTHSWVEHLAKTLGVPATYDFLLHGSGATPASTAAKGAAA